MAFVVDTTAEKEAERQLQRQREDIERLNAELEAKVKDRTRKLEDALHQLELSKDELGRVLADERKLSELKSRFVAMASHEFRTPLTAIQTSATLIEKFPGGDQQDKRQKHIDRIHVSVKNLNEILEEFLSVGKLEEGRIEARAVETSLSRLLADTVADMRLLLKSGQNIETHQGGEDLIRLDSSLLRKVMVNLVSNAIKYSGEGEAVTVELNCTEGLLTLSVKDRGVGISKEDQEHLFERFFRARNVGNVAGTGLGLHIVGRYVELIGGGVSLQSELNRGTTITVTLPYEKHPVD